MRVNYIDLYYIKKEYGSEWNLNFKHQCIAQYGGISGMLWTPVRSSLGVRSYHFSAPNLVFFKVIVVWLDFLVTSKTMYFCAVKYLSSQLMEVCGIFYFLTTQFSTKQNNVAPKMIYSKATMVNRIWLNLNPGQPEKSKKWYLVNNKSKILETAGRCATCPLLCSVWHIALVFLREVNNLTLRQQLTSTFRYPGVLLLLILNCRLPRDCHCFSYFIA